MTDDEEVGQIMAKKFYQKITGEIAKCESDISMAEPDRLGHHQDIVYESKVRKDALQTVLTSVIEEMEEEKVLPNDEEQ